jgi:hypothetical protein
VLLHQLERLADQLRSDGVEVDVRMLVAEYIALLKESMAGLATGHTDFGVDQFLDIAGRLKLAESAGRLIGGIPLPKPWYATSEPIDQISPKPLPNGSVIVWEWHHDGD